MRHPRVLLAPLLLFVLGPAACSTASPGGAAPQPDPIMIHVINRHPLDMKVFVVHGAERTRIGTATALGTTRFRLNPRLIRGLRDIRLYAEAIGSGGRVLTEMLVLHPGDAVDWSLAYDLDQSAVMVQ